MNNILRKVTEIVNYHIIYSEPKRGGREIKTSLSPFSVLIEKVVIL